MDATFFATYRMVPTSQSFRENVGEGEKQAEKDLSEPMMMVKEGSRKDGGHILPEIAQLFSSSPFCVTVMYVLQLNQSFFFLHWYDVTLGPAANL